MRVANNTCKWLLRGSTDLCGKKCMKEYCKVHSARLRQGSNNFSCENCGVAVRNTFKICHKCGYDSIYMRYWHRDRRAFDREFFRLSAIEV